MNTMNGLYAASGTRYWITSVLSRFREGIGTGIIIFFAIFGLRTLLRRDWIAAIAGAVIFTSQQSDLVNAVNWQVNVIVYLLVYTIIIFLMLKMGLVVTIATVFTINTLNGISLGSDWTLWYAPAGFATMILAIAIALWAFLYTVDGRDVLGRASI
jgi:hypothetical protein